MLTFKRIRDGILTDWTFMDGKAKQRAELASDLTPDLQDGVQAWRVM